MEPNPEEIHDLFMGCEMKRTFEVKEGEQVVIEGKVVRFSVYTSQQRY